MTAERERLVCAETEAKLRAKLAELERERYDLEQRTAFLKRRIAEEDARLAHV